MKRLMKLACMAAVLFAMDLFSATIVVKDPPGHDTTEYFWARMTFYDVAWGVRTQDEDGQPKLTIETRSVVRKNEVLRLQLKEGQESVDMACLDENGDLQWKPLKGRKAFVAYKNAAGSVAGMFLFEYELERGDGIPPAKCLVAGKLGSFKWNDKRQKYMAGNGSGHIAGGNDPRDFEAWHLAFPATNVQTDQIFSVQGGCQLITSGYWTGAQIKSFLKQK
ncbi:MAG: hypothetical protein J6Y62_03905 [Clostridia bacterium]|nr:hypothetical protein [Clostridia bacterium]